MIAHVFAGLAVGLAIVVLSRVAVFRFEWARALHREAHGLLAGSGDLAIAARAAAAAVVEEIAFRGGALPAFGLLASSIAFAALHVGPRARHLAWAGVTFACGIAFGLLTLHTGDLAAAIAAHFVVNFLNQRHVARHAV